jgi:hypothetical protein
MGWLAAAVVGLQLAQAPPADWTDKIDIGGEVAVLVDALPKQDATELRPELVVELAVEVSSAIRVRSDLVVSGLAARRYGESQADLLVRPRDGWVEWSGRRAEVRVGYGQVSWGRLDEIQPTDIINPLDASRFLLEGRAQARLPVGFARGRVYLSDDLVLEGVVVPWFRRGRFDELDESHSPFNLLRQPVPEAAALAAPNEVAHAEPATGWESVSGGGRLSATIGSVDVSTSA